jgi:hypothetical protein
LPAGTAGDEVDELSQEMVRHARPALVGATEPAEAAAEAAEDAPVAAAPRLTGAMVAGGTHPIVEEAKLLERVMRAADPTAALEPLADTGGSDSTATELRQALDELRRVLDVDQLPSRTRRRRGPWLLLGLLVLALVAGLAIGQGALDRFDIALPWRSAAPTASSTGTLLSTTSAGAGGAAGAVAPASPPTAEAQSVQPPAALPQTGPGISTPGTDVTVTFDNDQATDTIDVYEQAVFAAPGLDALPLNLAGPTALLGDVAALKPQVSDIQVELDGQPARAVPAGDGTWIAVPRQGGRFTRVQLRYSVTGAVARSTRSLPGRAQVLVSPLTGSQALRAGLPVSVRFTSAAVQGVSCPSAPLADSLCAVHSGDTWTALLPSSATSPIVVAQVNLNPPP